MLMLLMKETQTGWRFREMLAELDSLGIRTKVVNGRLFVAGPLTPELEARLREQKDQVWEEVWARQGRVRQAAALKRLADDRVRWVEECQRLANPLDS